MHLSQWALEATKTLLNNRLAVGVVFPSKFLDLPLNRVFSSTVAQSVEGAIELFLPDGNGANVVNSNRHISVSARDESADLKDAFQKDWIEDYEEVEGRRARPFCMSASLLTFKVIISVAEVKALHGILPVLGATYTGAKGHVEYAMRVTDETDTCTASWESLGSARTMAYKSRDAGTHLVSEFYDFPPIGTVPINFRLSSCNAYGCTNPVPFFVRPYVAPINLVANEVSSGKVVLKFQFETEESNLCEEKKGKNIFPDPKRFLVELRDQTGKEWVEVVASRHIDGPLGFVVGGLVHSTRVEFRVSALGPALHWARTKVPDEDEDEGEVIFPVHFRYRTGRLSQTLQVFTSGPTAPDAPTVPTLEGVSGGAVDISWMTPFNTGGIPLANFFLYIGASVKDSGPVTKGATFKYRVPDYEPGVSELFTLGNLKPFKSYEFAVVYSNAAEACYGPGGKSDGLRVTTTRMTAPGTAKKPEYEELTGGMIVLKVNMPKDLGGYDDGVTGYRIRLREISSGSSFAVVYDGTGKRTRKVTLSTLKFGMSYELLTMGMSFVDYADHAVGVKPASTPFAASQKMVSATADPRLTMSPFMWGSSAGKTIEFWMYVTNMPTADEVFSFLSFSDASGDTAFECSIQWQKIDWWDSADSSTVVNAPQLMIKATHPYHDNSAKKHESSIFSAYQGDGFPVKTWVHVALVAFGNAFPKEVDEAGFGPPQQRTNVGNLYLNGFFHADGPVSDFQQSFFEKNMLGNPFIIVDEMRLFNVPRSEDDIRDLMPRKLSPKQIPLIYGLAVYLPFDEAVLDLATGRSALYSASSGLTAVEYSKTTWQLSDMNGNHQSMRLGPLNTYFRDTASAEYDQDVWSSDVRSQQFPRNRGITVAIAVVSSSDNADDVLSLLTVRVEGSHVNKETGSKMALTCGTTRTANDDVMSGEAHAGSPPFEMTFDQETKKFNIAHSFCTLNRSTDILSKSAPAGACFNSESPCYLHTVRFRVLTRAQSWYMVQFEVKNSRRQETQVQQIQSVFISPLRLNALWRLSEGWGSAPADTSFVSPKAGAQKISLRLDEAHSYWYHDSERGPTVQLDGFALVTFNATGFDLRRTEWTMSFFIKAENVDDSYALIAQDGCLLYIDEDGRLHLSMETLKRSLDDKSDSTSISDVVACEGLNTYSWSHITVVHQMLPKQALFYKDGILCGIRATHSADIGDTPDWSHEFITVFGSASAPRFFGALSMNRTISGFRGLVSHLSVWSGALTREQIQMIRRGYYLDQASVVVTVGSGEISWINSTRGDGLPSAPLIFNTPSAPTKPKPPDRIEATKRTGGALSLQLVQPIDTGGQDILGYQVFDDNSNLGAEARKFPFLTKPSCFVGGLDIRKGSKGRYFFKAKVFTGDMRNPFPVEMTTNHPNTGKSLPYGEVAIVLNAQHLAEQGLDSTEYDKIFEARTKLYDPETELRKIVITQHASRELIGPYGIQRIESGENRFIVIDFTKEDLFFDFKGIYDELESRSSRTAAEDDAGLDNFEGSGHSSAAIPSLRTQLVFSMESDLTERTYFDTLPYMTPPGAPNPPYAILSSDEVMRVTFERTADTGGDDSDIKYELAIRNAVTKGEWHHIEDIDANSLVEGVLLRRVDGLEFLKENTPFQLKARASNKAGVGPWGGIGIGRTRDLCDLKFTCVGGGAVLLDWSACDPRNSKSHSDEGLGGEKGFQEAARTANAIDLADLVFQLVELEFPADEQENSFGKEKIIYSGTSFRFTRWDMDTGNNLAWRYRMRMMKRVDGKLVKYDMFSSYLRVGPKSVSAGFDLYSERVQEKEMMCNAANETIGSGTYGVGATRQWVISPKRQILTGDSKITYTNPLSHQGILVRFTRFDLECDKDNVTISIRSTGKIIWTGGCHRAEEFSVFSHTSDEDIVVALQSDASLSGQGFDAQYAAVPKGIRGLPLDISRGACPSRNGASKCNGHGTCKFATARASSAFGVQADGSFSAAPLEPFANTRPQQWYCQCDESYFGEACEFEAFCSGTVPINTSSKSPPSEFLRSVCKTPSDGVMAIWPFGRDGGDHGGTARLGTVDARDLGVQDYGTRHAGVSFTPPKPVRSVNGALRVLRDAKKEESSGIVSRFLLFPGTYRGFDVCNVTVHSGERIQIGARTQQDGTRVDCQSKTRFLNIDGGSVELSGFTIVSGDFKEGSGGSLVNVKAQGESRRLNPILLALVLREMRLSTSQNAPGLFVQGRAAQVKLFGTSMDSHKAGAIHLSNGASIYGERVSFQGNTAMHGACVLVEGTGTNIQLHGVSAKGVKALAAGGFMHASDHAFVKMSHLEVSEAGASLAGAVLAAASGASIFVESGSADDIKAGRRGGVAFADGVKTSISLFNMTVREARSSIGGVFAVNDSATIIIVGVDIFNAKASDTGGMAAVENGGSLNVSKTKAHQIRAENAGGYLLDPRSKLNIDSARQHLYWG